MEKLCQRGAASCGACCGLYNFADHGRDAVHARLRAHTERVRRAEKTPEAFRLAAQELKAGEAKWLFPAVRCCPLVGFLDEAQSRVGCLAHPLATGGPDLRDCGVYSGDICESFYCPSHNWLTEAEAALVAEVCGDYYLYGLAVTDVPFVRAALEAVAQETGAAVEARHLASPAFKAALKRLFALKEELMPGSEGLYGAFSPAGDGGEKPRRIDYVKLGAPPSRYDEILLCIGADPRSGNDLDALEELVKARVAACAGAFAAGAVSPVRDGRQQRP